MQVINYLQRRSSHTLRNRSTPVWNRKIDDCVSDSQMSITGSIGLFRAHRRSLMQARRKYACNKHTNLPQRVATAAAAHSRISQCVEATQAQHQHLLSHRLGWMKWEKQRRRRQRICDAELWQNDRTSWGRAGGLLQTVKWQLVSKMTCKEWIF